MGKRIIFVFSLTISFLAVFLIGCADPLLSENNTIISENTVPEDSTVNSETASRDYGSLVVAAGTAIGLSANMAEQWAEQNAIASWEAKTGTSWANAGDKMKSNVTVKIIPGSLGFRYYQVTLAVAARPFIQTDPCAGVPASKVVTVYNREVIKTYPLDNVNLNAILNGSESIYYNETCYAGIIYSTAYSVNNSPVISSDNTTITFNLKITYSGSVPRK